MGRVSPRVELWSWVAFRLGLTILLSLPRAALLRFASFAGSVGLRIARRYRHTTRNSLRIAFPEHFRPGRGEKPDADASDTRLERFMRLNWTHVFCSYLEGAFAPRMFSRTAWRHHFELQATPRTLEVLHEQMAKGMGVIFFTAHFGAWELSIHPTAAAGLPLTIVARPIDNRRIDVEVNRMRNRHGNRVISKFDSLKEQMRELRDGRTLGLVIDQDAGIKARGVFVRFFGRLCKVVDAPAIIAMRTGIPVIPGFCARVGTISPRYILYYYDPLDTRGDPHSLADAQRIMQDYHRCLEDIVRRHPEQYYWLHHKWRTRPPGEIGAPPQHIDLQPGAEQKARELGYFGGDAAR